MGSNGGVRTKIAIYGTWPRAGGPIAGISDIFVHDASLRSSQLTRPSSVPAEYPQLHLLQGHQERVRNAAVRCSLPFAYAVEGPTLYEPSYMGACGCRVGAPCTCSCTGRTRSEATGVGQLRPASVARACPVLYLSRYLYLYILSYSEAVADVVGWFGLVGLDQARDLRT